jgi:AcrR family transcriptional regulator
MKTALKTSHDRLLETVFEQWEVEGHAAMSARRISSAADVPVSSIYHHFGSLEQLFSTAQEAALTAAQSWCDEQLQQLSELTGNPAAFAPLFSQIVDGWSHEQRRLAFAWREGMSLARRNDSFRECADKWTALWSQFWQEVARKFELGEQVVIVGRIFDNESFMHMLRWHRLTDRACLDEFGRGLGAWLSGIPAPEAPWREFARGQALRSMPPAASRDETAARIAAVAGEIIGTDGLTSLTHRAVAERAGLTLGMVIHKFRTKSQLVEAAFEDIYLAVVDRLKPPSTPSPSTQDGLALDIMADLISRNASERGGDELILAAARDPSLHQFAAQLRYLRGRTSITAVQAIIGEEGKASNLEAALLSSFASSVTRAYADVPAIESRDIIRNELEILASLIRKSREH